MSAIKLFAFDGLIPRMSPTLLGENFSQVATNVKLYSGELRFWRGPIMVHGTAPDRHYRTLFRLFHQSGDTVESAFLLWENEVNVAISPTADASDESRIYYTGDGPPKKTNWEMATGGAEPYPSSSMPMGVHPPTDPATLVLSTPGTGAIESRAYVYTNVSQFGAVQAESAPSPVPDPPIPGQGTIDVPVVGSTVTISGFTPPNPDENVTHRRIYRTVVGATTVTYLFVAEIDVGSGSYADSLPTSQLGEALGTIGWLPPPDNLEGLVVLPGGSLVGFVDNTVYFSEPHMPHAWPEEYAITLPVLLIIGLGIVGSSVVVMTGTNPYFIHGGFPGDMYTEKIPLVEPCVARGTIALDEEGVVYASPNGLVGISPSTRGVITKELFTADEWRPLTPLTMKATILQGRYFGVFPNQVPAKAIVLSRDDPPALSHLQLPAIALHTDARNGFLFYVSDSDHKVYQLDANAAMPMSYHWKSKRFWSGRALTFSLLRLDANYDQVADDSAYDALREQVIQWNEDHFGQDLLGSINSVPIHGPEGDPITGEGRQAFDINGSILRNLPLPSSARYAQIVLYGDDGLVRATLSPTDLDPIRVKAFKARQLEVEINGNIDVRSLTMATTMEELLAAQ